MRKPRRRAELSRSKPKRKSYDRVLIVCEGSKTEPSYFREIVQRHRLSTANIRVEGEGADPLAIVKKAKELLQVERKSGENFDKVYCVFDRDEHASFENASSVARDSKLELSRSWPCFEFWILLHFRFTREPFARVGKKSPARNCIASLLTEWSKFSKGKTDTFKVLENRLEEAKDRAEKALNDARKTGEPNPSTEVHKLVGYLQGLKKKSDGG